MILLKGGNLFQIEDPSPENPQEIFVEPIKFTEKDIEKIKEKLWKGGFIMSQFIGCNKEDNWCQREKRGCTGCAYEDKRVIPVKKIQEEIEKNKKIINEIEKEIQEELNSEDICKEYIRDKRREIGLANRDITVLQQLIKENCEEE